MRKTLRIRDSARFVSFAIAIGIILRPLTFTEVGDFLIYLKGSNELALGIDLYDINRAPFGSRYFNGPLLAILLYPFTFLDPGLALIAFRALNLIAIVFAFEKISGLKFRKNLDVYLLLLLFFPIRMNTNLAQGFGIALLLYLWACNLLFNKKIEGSAVKNQAYASVAFIVASNYKPQLGFLMFIFAIVMGKKLFAFLVVVQITLFEVIVLIFDWNFSYLDWLKILIERTARIQAGSSEAIFGPFSLFGLLFKFNPTLLMVGMVIALLILVVFIAIRCRSAKNQEFDIQFCLLTFALAPLTVSYSPLQDSIAVILLFLAVSNQKSQNRFGWVETTSFIFLLLPTDVSILGFSALIALGVILATPKRLDFRILLPLFFSIVFVIETKWYSHMIYDLAGVGVLILTLKITIKNIGDLMHLTREDGLRRSHEL